MRRLKKEGELGIINTKRVINKKKLSRQKTTRDCPCVQGRKAAERGFIVEKRNSDLGDLRFTA